MSILEKVKDNSIMICPYAMQEKMMKEFVTSYANLHVKWLDKTELINGTYFTYDASTLLYLKNKYQYSFAISEEILDNLKGIKLKETSDYPKLEKIKNIYQDLIENKKLSHHSYFQYLFANKEVYVYGYSRFDLEIQAALHSLHVPFQYLEDDEKKFSHQVTVFSTIEEEVTSLFIEIGNLIKNGVSLNNIYLFDYPSEYELLIEKYANYHHLIIESRENAYLYDSPIYKTYITYLSNYSFEDAFSLLNQNVKYDHFHSIEKLIDVLTLILPLQTSKIEKIELLNYLAKKKILAKPLYEQQIRLCNCHSIIQDDEYVFMIGFSLGNYPKMIHDTAFYSDEEKTELGLNTSNTLSIINEEELTTFIHHTKNLNITYKKKNGKLEYYPSLLIEKLKMKVDSGTIPNIRYSSKVAKLDVGKAKDLLENYNIDTPIIQTYTNEELEYKAYHHQFKGLIEYYNDDVLRLSYSLINEYNKCPFSYYVKEVLKIGEFDENFGIKLGKLYHKILEDSAQKEVKLEEYQSIINSSFLSAKEKFFVSHLLPQVFDVIQKNNEFLKETKYQNVETEKKLTVQIDENTILNGIIDKIMMDDTFKNLIIIDYKTNDFKFKKQKTNYGIDMQLPVYAYLLDVNYPQFGKTGIYIQNVCLNSKELLDENRYKLAGLTVRSMEEIKRLEPSLGTLFDNEGKLIQKSNFIRNCSLKAGGKELAIRGFIEKEEMNELTKIAKKQILLANDNIRNGVFPISPAKFKGELSYACSYCKLKDICFVKEGDIRYIDIMEESTNEI